MSPSVSLAHSPPSAVVAVAVAVAGAGAVAQHNGTCIYGVQPNCPLEKILRSFLSSMTDEKENVVLKEIVLFFVND